MHPPTFAFLVTLFCVLVIFVFRLSCLHHNLVACIRFSRLSVHGAAAVYVGIGRLHSYFLTKLTFLDICFWVGRLQC